MEIVVFDLWGDYAHFRVPYTTSSPLAFPIPPKTALYGIVSAVLGYDKNNYLEIFNKENWEFAISIKNKITTVRIPENLINTKAVKMFSRMPRGKACRTQINIEFLKAPYYRIYVSSENHKELNRLKQLLKEHKSNYTISLGISECLANFKYIGSYPKVESKNNDFFEISSIIPLKYIQNSSKIDFLKEDSKFLRVHLPLEMKPDRELVESKDFLLEATGKNIRAKLEYCIYLEQLKENILLF